MPPTTPDPSIIPEIHAILAAIERGDIKLTPHVDARSVYCGHVQYIASNGWKFAIFDDCDEWDYFDRIEAPDGRWVDFDTLWNHDRDGLADYEPTQEQMARVWSWP